MTDKKYDRQIRFFGGKGQKKLQGIKVSVVGVGGLGTHVVQQLAYLGINTFYLIDDELLDDTNMNRYVGARPYDVGEKKVDIAKRIITEINSDASVSTIPYSLQSEEAFEGIINSDCVFGCLDNEGSRLVLNELSSAYQIPYFDLASEIFPEESVYGGRICISIDGEECIDCWGYLDREEASRDLESPESRRDREEIYGVNTNDLDGSGPAVVSINGVIASLAITEFIVWATELRNPRQNLIYYGNESKVMVSIDEPRPDCYYCSGVKGKEGESDVHRFLTNKNI